MATKITFLTLLLTISVIGHSQTPQSLLYNVKGQLRSDTSLKINRDQLLKWKSVEDFVVRDIISKMAYSPLAVENYISGQVIISFDVDSTKQLKDFKIIKKLDWGIDENIKIFLRSSKYLASIAPMDNKTYTYFLSFDFKVIEAAKYIEEYNSIPIQKVMHGFIQY